MKKKPLDFKGIGHSKVGYFKDVRSKIDELERLNIQLASRRNRLEAVFNSMSEGLTILDRHLNIVFTNRVQRKLFPELSELPKKCHEVFNLRRSPCPECPALRTLGTREMLHGESVFKKGHLKGRYYEWTTSPVKDIHGNVDEILLIMRDITERKQYELKLLQADRMAAIGFLASGIAHEINNPLTSIAGFSEGLLKRLKTIPELQGGRHLASFGEYLEIINSEAYRCRDIIQNLREFSRNSSDSFEAVGMDEIVTSTLTLIRQHAKDRKINIVYRNYLTTGFDKVWGKQSQLKHLLLNLIGTVFKSMASGGELLIVCRNDEDRIDIQLSDPQDRLTRKLSEGFHSFSPNEGTSDDGTSLDLAICYNIIQQHRGVIVSNAEDAPSGTFMLRFPAIIA